MARNVEERKKGGGWGRGNNWVGQVVVGFAKIRTDFGETHLSLSTHFCQGYGFYSSSMVSFQNLKEHCSFFFAFSSITRESWGYVRANLHMSILSTAATYTSATFTSATFTTGLIESVIRGLVVYESSHTSQLD